jgi:branched-chain amino acid transport system ATP-binding protein
MTSERPLDLPSPVTLESGSDTILDVRNVGLSIGGVRALDDVSFSVSRGETFAIIGPNGAGKSSLFNILSGFLRPTSGQVVFADRRLDGSSASEVSRLGVSRTFQELGLFEDMSVLDNLLVGGHRLHRGGVVAGMLWLGRARRQEIAARTRIEHYLDSFGLDEHRNRPVRDLPYGVRKRVEIARAVASRPSLLLLDEPVAGIGGEDRNQLIANVLKAQVDLGFTMLIVEHDLPLVMRLASRALVLDFGRVVACDVPAVIQRDPRVIAAYIGAEVGASAESGDVASQLASQ